MEPPSITLFICFVSFVMSLAQALLTMRFANPRLMKQMGQEVRSFKTELQSAKKLGDKKALKALEKRRAYMRQREERMSAMQLRLTTSGIVVSFVVFYVLTSWLQMTATVAIVPAPLLLGDQPIEINALIWFVISSVFFSIIMRRAGGS